MDEITFQDPELDNFLSKINEIGAVIQGFNSDNPETVQKSIEKADVMLNCKDDIDIDENSLVVKTDKSIINQAMSSNQDGAKNQETMSQEAFMMFVEQDAMKRANERKERQTIADAYKLKGNEAFRKGDFNCALQNYTKAIDQIRDSCILYNNRALAELRLGLNSKAIADCDMTLMLEKNNLKALLYKGKALQTLKLNDEAVKCYCEALKLHPSQKASILAFRDQWDTNH